MPSAFGPPARSSASDSRVDSLDDPAQARFAPDAVECVDLKLIPRDHPFGQVSAVSGEGAFRYIERAVRIVEAGQADAICTAPLSKEALHAAGHKYPGHTELLAMLTGTPEVSMMLVSPKLRVIHVTTHIGLIDAIERIEPGLVERVIGRAHYTLVKAGIASPKIGVCAINPHAGENGLFGRGEEAERSFPRSRPARPRAGTSMDRCLPTRCSSWPGAATTTSSWRCITIRAMARSRCSVLKPA